MTTQSKLPLILIVDDVLGRETQSGINDERENICAQFALVDETQDSCKMRTVVTKPIARAVFHRGQSPSLSLIGDSVENDLLGILDKVSSRWSKANSEKWAMLLLDLSFVTGVVTNASNKAVEGSADARNKTTAPSDYFGLQVLKAVQDRFPDLPVAIFSSKDRAPIGRTLAIEGAVGFISTDAPNGHDVLAQTLFHHGLYQDEDSQIIGSTKGLLIALRQARRSAVQERNVCIIGEAGSGKNELAMYLNKAVKNSRRPRSFIHIQCAALDLGNYRKQLFGYKRGAFIGADNDKAGSIELASGGDIFLDEIAELPEPIQVSLSQIFDDGFLIPEGGNSGDKRRVRARFIGSTSSNLSDLIASNKVRRDFFERLAAGGIIKMPNLTERRDDLAMLLEHFVRLAENETGFRRRTISDEAIDFCKSRLWPGNIRQFRNAAYSAVLNNPDTDFLLKRHFSESFEPGTLRRSREVTLRELINEFEKFDLTSQPIDSLGSQLSPLEKAYGDLLVEYLRISLHKHQSKSGEYKIAPAIKFMTGRDFLSTSSAYDTINRIMKISGVSPQALDENDPVKVAWKRSRQIRSSGPNNKRK